jgi:haloalkane dehalogenase
MWLSLMGSLAAAGWRAVAPDLYGMGASEPDPPATWERAVEAIGRFHEDLALGRVALCVHDWGGLAGLAWACEHPDAVSALVIANSGFFPDGRWHGLAKAVREPGTGEEVAAALSRETIAMTLRGLSPGIDDDAIDEYWAGLERRPELMLEFYRSCDFEKLAPYDGGLAALGVPTLLVWGGKDEMAPVGGAYRFRKEIPGAELVVLEDAGHFVFEDEPQETARVVTQFLARARAA